MFANGPGRKFCLALAFCEGATVMIAEIAAARMLAPVYGSSIYVWGAIIGVTLISLTLGYHAGGIISDRPRARRTLAMVMLLAAIAIFVMPTFADPLAMATESLPRLVAIALVAATLLGPPLVLLGMVPPLLVARLAGSADQAGNAAGRIYGVSTVGGILATFASGFWLIPEFGLGTTARLGGTTLAALPILWLLAERQWWALVAPAAAMLVAAVPGTPVNTSGAEILYHSEGLLGQLMVVDLPITSVQPPRTDRVLFVNRTAQTWIERDTGEPVWDYVRFIESLASLQPSGSRALLLGLGGGTIAGRLQDVGFTVDGVELDPRIAQVARRYFGLELSGDLFVDDGRHHLRVSDRRYDLILFDVFQAEVPPVHLLTREAFELAGRRLAPGGMIIVNYSGYLTGSAGRGARAIWQTLLAAGFTVDVLPTGEDEHLANNLFIAHRGSLDYTGPRKPLRVHRRPRAIPDLLLTPGSIDRSDALVLRDDRPVLDRLNLEASQLWRQTYFEHFTRPMRDQGVPLFD